MTSRSRTETLAGVFFLITEVSTIAGPALYQPALAANYLGGAGADGRVVLGVAVPSSSPVPAPARSEP
jgi:hypothetical protein